jgi:hypothetical protein
MQVLVRMKQEEKAITPVLVRMEQEEKAITRLNLKLIHPKKTAKRRRYHLTCVYNFLCIIIR